MALAVGQRARTAPPSSRGAKRRGDPGVAAAGPGPRPWSRQAGQPGFSPTRFAYARSLRARLKRERLRRARLHSDPAQTRRWEGRKQPQRAAAAAQQTLALQTELQRP